MQFRGFFIPRDQVLSIRKFDLALCHVGASKFVLDFSSCSSRFSWKIKGCCHWGQWGTVFNSILFKIIESIFPLGFENTCITCGATIVLENVMSSIQKILFWLITICFIVKGKILGWLELRPTQRYLCPVEVSAKLLKGMWKLVDMRTQCFSWANLAPHCRLMRLSSDSMQRVPQPHYWKISCLFLIFKQSNSASLSTHQQWEKWNDCCSTINQAAALLSL